MPTIQAWGAVRAAAVRAGVPRVYDHQKSTVKLRITDGILKAMGCYVKGMKHGNDATRHVVNWLADGGLLPAHQVAMLIPPAAQEAEQEGSE